MIVTELSTAFNRDRLTDGFARLPRQALVTTITTMVLERCRKSSKDVTVVDIVPTDSSETVGIYSELLVTPSSLLGSENLVLTHRCLDPECTAARTVWSQLVGTAVETPADN